MISTTFRSMLLFLQLFGLTLYSTATFADEMLDKDHDGIADAVDKCPDTPQIKKIDKTKIRIAAIFPKEYTSQEPVSVPVDKEGCTLDTDKDGIADHMDYCPEDTAFEISAGVSANGCPLQSDGDGTPDYRDRCPDTPKGVPADKFGCPT